MTMSIRHFNVAIAALFAAFALQCAVHGDSLGGVSPLWG